MTPALFLIVFALGCGKDTPAPIATNASAKVVNAKGQAIPKAKRQTEQGWGAVFWRNATAWKVGGGSVVVGPRGATEVRTRGEVLACEGIATKGAPSHGALVLPEGSSLPKVPASPAIQAHRVERAAWRLDEVLPPRGRFSAGVNSAAPSQQRGIDVGSVTKTRRHGAPPFLISTGVRDCVGVVALMDLKAEATLVYDRIGENCSPLRVLPAFDYDGDGNREFAVFSEEQVAIYRLTEAPGILSMVRIADFACASGD